MRGQWQQQRAPLRHPSPVPQDCDAVQSSLPTGAELPAAGQHRRPISGALAIGTVSLGGQQTSVCEYDSKHWPTLLLF